MKAFARIMSYAAVTLASAALLFGAGLLTGRRLRRAAAADPAAAVRTDTVLRVDTVSVTVTRLVELRRTDTVYVTDIDTVTLRDTFFHAVPLTQAHYTDSLYEAWVSGYRPSLDSIRLFMPYRQVTVERAADTGAGSRWGLGVSTGMAVGSGGITPYAGIGITYMILSF